jgi:hypothetical protein
VLNKGIAIVEALLPLVSTAVLRSAWVELDLGVRGVLWQPLLTFLRGASDHSIQIAGLML